MSRGKNLQEMETDTKQSKTAVNAGAKAAEPMQKLTTGIPDGQTGSWEDLGGPTPENYKPDDDSAKLSTPGATLKQVKNVVNKGAKAADAMKSLAKESVEEDEEEEEEVTFGKEDIYLKTTDGDFILISSNNRRRQKNVGCVYNLYNDGRFDDVNVRVFNPKKIIFEV